MTTPAEAPLKASRVVALAASAGGLRALTEVLSRLPADLPAAVVVVQHLMPGHPSHLASILGRHTLLKVEEARHGCRLLSGTVYTAPPDHHLRVTHDGTLALSHEGPVRFVRPAATLLFESIAISHGQGAIAVVLTGSGADGADGLAAVKRLGGMVIAQDEATSEFFGMPDAAVRTGAVDLVLPLKEIADAVIQLLSENRPA